VDWYQRRRAEQLRAHDATNPQLAALLRSLDAIYLFGTFGFEAVMRPDGSVLVSVDEHWGEPDAPEPPWRPATREERLLSIAVASERWPEIASLLPQRPADARTCPACHGQGTVPLAPPRIFCNVCGALGWLPDAAT
jgi:hypothetical protein